jgi:hypothetical protein
MDQDCFLRFVQSVIIQLATVDVEHKIGDIISPGISDHSPVFEGLTADKSAEVKKAMLVLLQAPSTRQLNPSLTRP